MLRGLGHRRPASVVSQHLLLLFPRRLLSLFHEAFGRESLLPLVTSSDEKREIAVCVFAAFSLLHGIPDGVYFMGTK